MKSIALVIGNAEYPNGLRLNNAVNDAQDIAIKLETLGYDTVKKFNCTEEEFHEVIAEFSDILHNSVYEVGLFYFSGHGVQIDGLNYLTAIDTRFYDKSSVTHSSIQLSQLINTIQDAGTRIKIIILDACRDNPFPNTFRGGIVTSGLAPVYAPKGTIVAFSTSPGEKAKDGGMGRNSIYTGTLLKHIDDRNIPIEDVFKRVRASVHNLSNGDQTSWEHTSLIGDYYFNYGQQTYSLTIPYRSDVVIDSDYLPDESTLGAIIKDLKSYNWTVQELAINRIRKANLINVDQSDLFLIGRNILQAAQGSSYTAIDKIKNLQYWQNGFDAKEKEHIINGIFFEIYFNSKGKFRGEKRLKSNCLFDLLKHQNKEIYKQSISFIQKQLQPFQSDLFYIPGNPDFVLPIEIQIKEINNDEDPFSEERQGIHRVTSIKYQETELLHEKHSPRNLSITKTYEDFKNELANTFHIPLRQLRIITTVAEDDISVIELPYFYEINRDPLLTDSDL